MTNERKQSALSKERSFKHVKTTSSFLYSMYHQQAGKTSLFHMREAHFAHFNTCGAFKSRHDEATRVAVSNNGWSKNARAVVGRILTAFIQTSFQGDPLIVLII